MPQRIPPEDALAFMREQTAHLDVMVYLNNAQTKLSLIYKNHIVTLTSVKGYDLKHLHSTAKQFCWEIIEGVNSYIGFVVKKYNAEPKSKTIVVLPVYKNLFGYKLHSSDYSACHSAMKWAEWENCEVVIY